MKYDIIFIVTCETLVYASNSVFQDCNSSFDLVNTLVRFVLSFSVFITQILTFLFVFSTESLINQKLLTPKLEIVDPTDLSEQSNQPLTPSESSRISTPDNVINNNNNNTTTPSTSNLHNLAMPVISNCMAMSAPTKQPSKRRVRRRATSQSHDPAEALTEMSVRGLNLFRYASINEGVYQCTECAKVDVQKTFKNKYSFQRHAFLYHEGHQRKVFPCPVCQKEFSRPDKMKNHMKTVHDCFMPKDVVFPTMGFFPTM